MSIETQPNNPLIERLFKAGAHFGFSKSRRHPSIKPFLFGNKQGTDIFDLEKTASSIADAKKVLEAAGAEGKVLVVVSSKEETSALVKEAAIAADLPYVSNRWIGGVLTNFSEIKKRIDRMHRLAVEGESGELERKYTKKERVVIGREIEKLHFNFGGIKKLERIPSMMLVVDPRHDHIAVTEANDMKIPVVGIMSSDNNTRLVTYPVIVNDALQTSVSLVLAELLGAYTKGKATYVPKPTARVTSEHRRPARRPE